MRTSTIDKHFTKEEQDLIIEALLQNEYPRLSKLVLVMNTMLAFKGIRLKRQISLNVVKYWLKTHYPEVYEELKRRREKREKEKPRYSLKDLIEVRRY